ncbi:MAG: glycosyl hydrolase [Bacteroidetes bacterium]|nr:MAG: glycosyl hydrolase [Bacteroidota bacterium]TAG89774.1 MAG: glycosyl hydrolase [Bacteroidota bacterium]
MKKYLFVFLLLGLIQISNAQNISHSRVEEKLQSFKNKQELQKNSWFKKYPIKSIGPCVMGGRVIDIEVNPKNTNEFYVAYASNGVYKTENNGQNFIPIFDNLSRITIGDIALSKANPNIIWVGTGENNASRSGYAGMGVYKSNNAGKTWEFCGLEDTQHIGRIVTHPTNENIAFVASIGALYSKNTERGVYKTIDGGKNWKKTLFINDSTGVIDMVIHPKNPNLMWACAWERSRKANFFKESGENSGLYFSENAGETWTKLEKDLPQGKQVGRMGIAISESNPEILYIVLDNQEKIKETEKKQTDANKALTEAKIKGCEVYISTNTGKNWKKINKSSLEGVFYTYGYYFGQIQINPKNANHIYIFGVPFLKSIDGGKTYKSIAKFNKVHPDHHALWINPNNENHFILGNDGGIYTTYDGGKTYAHLNNTPAGQFYTISTDNETPYNVYGGLQDNGTYKGSSKTEPDDTKAWELLSWGDGMYVQVHPKDAKIYYSGYQFGNYSRTINGKSKRITPKKIPDIENLRFNWRTPLLMSKHNPDVLYMCSQVVLKSNNQGTDWEKISDDLTQNLPQKNVPFSTISAFSESPLDKNILYVGTDDGWVWVTKNGGKNWTKIIKNIPEGRWVSSLFASNIDKNIVFLSLSGYRNDDITTYIYKSTDFGETWTSIKGNIPNEAVNVLIQDNQYENILYCGTDEGAYISIDSGKNWHVLTGNFPNVATYDMCIQTREKELVLATHGRSIFVMDLKPLYELTEKNLQKNIILFDIDKIKLDKEWGKQYDYDEKNEPEIKIKFFIPKNKENINIVIKDKENKIIYQTNIKTQIGFDSLVWNGQIDEKDKTKYIEIGKYTIECEGEKISFEVE